LAFEALAVATAMPAVADALGGLSLYALSFGGMVATSALGMVWAGPLCDRRGPGGPPCWAWPSSPRAALAGGASSMAGVAAGRVVQGLGSGLLGVALYVGMGRVVPPALHPRLFALFAAAWVLPGLVGPALAATLVHQLGWRAVFLAVAALVPVAGLLLRPAFAPLASHPAPADGASPTPSLGALAWAALAAGALALHEAGSGP
jgi:MFS family permease